MSRGLIQPRTVYNRTTGALTMHGVDAASAVSNHPREWSYVPWTDEVVAKVEANIKRNEELNRVPVVGALEQEDKP
jgi:hypothetical protein